MPRACVTDEAGRAGWLECNFQLRLRHSKAYASEGVFEGRPRGGVGGLSSLTACIHAVALSIGLQMRTTAPGQDGTVRLKMTKIADFVTFEAAGQLHL